MTVEERLEQQPSRTSLITADGTCARLCDLLSQQARRYPGEWACVILDARGRETDKITYRELDRRARAVAAVLQRRAAPGERALLALPNGVDFPVALFACAYAGIVAIPVPAPGEGLANGAARLASIVQDATPTVVLTHPEIAARPGEHGLGGTYPVAVAQVSAELAEAFRDPGEGTDALALLQYTSGSTSEPKGVQISHRNILANLTDLYTTLPLSLAPGDRLRIASWLPLFHDMGLAQLLLPVVTGGMVALTSPTSFLLRPVSWLEAITRYKAHMATAPNFAYDLCARRSTEQERRELDLSGWRFALNGSEPVRSGTLDLFARTFADAGFDPVAYVPCYGLAEATVYVSGARGVSGRITASLPALQRDSLVRAPDGEEPGLEVVSCGPVAGGLELRIADPGTCRELQAGAVGEIWLAGDSVSRGYWRQPDERFNGCLADSPARPFLRTGDLGCRIGGQIYVLGRLDDVIVLDGRNHHPQDIEFTAQQSHPALAAGRVAAFGYSRDGETAIAVVAETARRVRVARPGAAAGPDQLDGGDVVRAVRSAVSAEHQIRVAQVILLRPAGLPRTTSGKVRRKRCRELFLAGGLKTW
ncbi:MAG TPA: fatty acyl-AMP ligase [Streptosporangiaceae bacterium]|nr:fatty acyl-AMP ligase [Streptosporangiaceae bacterium]